MNVVRVTLPLNFQWNEDPRSIQRAIRAVESNELRDELWRLTEIHEMIGTFLYFSPAISQVGSDKVEAL